MQELPKRLEAEKEELNWLLDSRMLGRSSNLARMLNYICEKHFQGQIDQINEHGIATEALGRRGDFDPNSDTIVRVVAHSLRKRLHTVYQTVGSNRPVQIHIPTGQYAPSFVYKDDAAQDKPSQQPTNLSGPEQELASVDTGPLPALSKRGLRWFVPLFKSKGAAPATSPLRRSHSLWWAAAVFLFTLFVIGAYSYRKAYTPRNVDMLWGPLLHSPDSVLIVIGTSDDNKPVVAATIDHLRGPYHHITMSSALALARLTGFLQANGKAFEIKDDREVSLTDFRSRPVILIGAWSNPWTLRLTDPLRFRFEFGSLLSRIQDRNNPNSNEWSDPSSYGHYDTSTSDYALIARYHDTTTNGTVMTISGIEAYGTEAASEFVISPQYIDQLLSKVPADWENRNLEIVIRTDKINGEAGPPFLVSSTYW